MIINYKKVHSMSKLRIVDGIFIDLNDNSMTICVCGKYDANNWGAQYGCVQSVLFGDSIQATKEIVVDMLHCIEIDAIPFLSLLLDL